MKVTGIRLKDFRSHEMFETELEKFTIVTGPNGSGKSSIVEAVATVLIGQNSWTDRDGVKLQHHIRKGAKTAKVTLIGKRQITRTLRRGGSQLSLDDGDTLTQAMIYKNLNVEEQHLRACLIPQAFLTLTLKEQKDTLFNLLSSEMTITAVGKRMPKESADVWKKLVTRWKEEHPDEKGVDIDELYKFVQEARRRYKAKISSQPADDAPDNKELVGKLSELSQKIAGANFDNERVKAGKAMRAKLPDLKKRLAELTEGRPKLDELQDTLKKSEENLVELQKRLAGIEAIAQENAADLDIFGEPKTKKGKVVCPLGLECAHDDAALKKRKSYLKGLKTSKDEEKKALQEKIRAARSIKTKNESTLLHAQTCVRDIEDLEAEIQQALGIEDEEFVDVQALQAEKAEVQKQLEKLSSPKASASDATVVKLDAIVDALNVHGIKTEVIKEEATGLEKEVNDTLSKFGDWKVRFFVDETYQPTIITSRGECFLGELSDGERALLSLILQDVFAQRSGIGVVVMDNVDLLDPAACKAFVNTALRVKSQVLVAMANSKNIMMGDGDPMKIVTLGPPKKSPVPQEQVAKDEPAEEDGEKPIEDLL